MTRMALRRNGRAQGQPTRIYLWRHPEPAGADQGRFLGQTDPRLSPRGRQQAAEMAQRMAEVELAAVYSSDLIRSQQAAGAISRAQPGIVRAKAMASLRELNLGRWEGKTFAQVQREFAQDVASRLQDPLGFRIPGGESLSDLAGRVLPVFKDLVESSRGKAVCLVGHAGVNRVIICWLLGAPLENLFRLQQDYACLNLIEVFPDGVPILKTFNQRLWD